VVKNAGTSIKFIDQSDPLPLSFVLGNSLKVGPKLTLTLDGAMTKGTGATAAGGAEWTPVGDRLRGLSLRGGYTTKRNKIEKLSGASLGMGFAVGAIMIDYAWIPYGELGDSHAVTLLWNLPNIQWPVVRKNRHRRR
jgi:hypothetical protein